MKLRAFILAPMVLALSASLALAQTNQGASPLTPAKGGTNSKFVGFAGPASTVKTFTLPNASGTIAVLDQIQTWTGAQSFADGKLILLGSSSGAGTLKAPSAASSYVWTLPAATGTLADIASSQTLTNKTFNTANNTFTLNGAAFGNATQATAALNAMVGDSGSGGTKGLVPAPASGDAAAGKYLKADGTYDIPPGGSGLAAATQAEMETGTSTAVASTPGRQKNHPAHPKAWAYVTQSGGSYTLAAAIGVSAVTKAATGRVDITLSTAFSSTSYAVTAMANEAGPFTAAEVLGSRTTTNFRINLRNANTNTDTDSGFSVTFYGDQ